MIQKMPPMPTLHNRRPPTPMSGILVLCEHRHYSLSVIAELKAGCSEAIGAQLIAISVDTFATPASIVGGLPPAIAIILVAVIVTPGSAAIATMATQAFPSLPLVAMEVMHPSNTLLSTAGWAHLADGVVSGSHPESMFTSSMPFIYEYYHTGPQRQVWASPPVGGTTNVVVVCVSPPDMRQLFTMAGCIGNGKNLGYVFTFIHIDAPFERMRELAAACVIVEVTGSALPDGVRRLIIDHGVAAVALVDTAIRVRNNHWR